MEIRRSVKTPKFFEEIFIFNFYLFVYFALFRAAPTAYGGFQARGLMGAIAAGLRHSHSHSHIRSELPLQPMTQLEAMLDP